jgi:hypothetical protein
MLPENKMVIIENILRWRDILGVPIAIENTPVGNDGPSYLRLLAEISDKTSAAVACDLPHVLISLAGGSISKSAKTSIIRSLNVKQVHVGGIRIANGQVRDNHKGLSQLCLKLLSTHFQGAEYITLEQNHEIPPTVVRNWLTEIRKSLEKQESEKRDPLEEIEILQPFPEEILNEDLTKSAGDSNGLDCEPLSVPTSLDEASIVPCSSLDIFNKYIPFIWPLDSVIASAPRSPAQITLKNSALLARWSRSFSTWWEPNLIGADTVTFIDQNNGTFSRKIFGEDSQTETEVTFEINPSQIVKIRTPTLQKEDVYDTGDI